MKKTMLTRIVALLLIAAFLPTAALAEEYNIDHGSISVAAKSDGHYVSQSGVTDSTPGGVKQTTPTVITSKTGETTGNTVTISADAGQTAAVTIKDVNISSSDAAITTAGRGDVTLTLEGNNTVQSGTMYAGVQKENKGSLTITAEKPDEGEDPGKLTANGGYSGAGIGGGYMKDGSSITIGGNAQVEANGGDYAAGIGGGNRGTGTVTIEDNADVTATGGQNGAGIGGGKFGGSDITIAGSAQVNATGGTVSAGIGGGGFHRADSDITIKDSAQVNATGGNGGAGIGGGGSGKEDVSVTIAIGGNAQVNATGGQNGAGIGGGSSGVGNITIAGSAQVNATGGEKGAGIGNGWAASKASSISIKENVQIRAQGSSNGAAFGTGFEQEPDPDSLVKDLDEGGWIAYYAPGAKMEADAPAKVIYKKDGTVHTVSDGITASEKKDATCTTEGLAGFTADGIPFRLNKLGHNWELDYEVDRDPT